MPMDATFPKRNIGTAEEPQWEKYAYKTLADFVYVDENESQNIKQYVDGEITDLLNGAPAAYDTLKELADAITENEGVVEALDNAIDSKADKSELLYTNSTPTVQAHGGVAAGTTFDEMPITDVLNKILYPWVAPTVSVSVVTPSNGGGI